MPRRRRRREKKKTDMFFNFFLKTNSANFWKFWEFLPFSFLLWFPLEKCLLVQSAFSAALVGRKILEKKLDAGFEIFHIFYAKKRPFFSIFGPPCFRPGGFFGITLNYLHRKIFSGLPPPISTHLKIPSLLKSDATFTANAEGGGSGAAHRALFKNDPPQTRSTTLKVPSSQTESRKKVGNLPLLGHPPWVKPHFDPGFGFYMVWGPQELPRIDF